MEVNHIAEILEDLERRDIYKVSKHGITEDLERQLASLCTEYRNGSPSGRGALMTAINYRKATNRAQWLLQSFSSHMATRAMQRKDRVALSSGIIALHLSNVANIDPRDSLGPIARLAYAAQHCGLELAEYTTAVCPDVSPKLMEWIRKPGPVNVGPDEMGILCSNAPLKPRLAVHVGTSSSRLIVRRENLPKTDRPDLDWFRFLASDPQLT